MGPDNGDIRYVRAEDELGDVWPLLDEIAVRNVHNGTVGAVQNFGGRPAFWYIDSGQGYVAVHQ
jgi:hypothetical protein